MTDAHTPSEVATAMVMGMHDAQVPGHLAHIAATPRCHAPAIAQRHH